MPSSSYNVVVIVIKEASLFVLYSSSQHDKSLHPCAFQLVESEEVDSSQVSAGPCGGPTSENTRELSGRADHEDPRVWSCSLPRVDVAAGVQWLLLSAQAAALIGTFHSSQKCGTEKTLRTFALC